MMGAGCANESPVSAPDPVAPSFLIAAEGTSVDTALLEQFATQRCSPRRDGEQVLVVLRYVDNPRAMDFPTGGRTAR
jgi:hypothetical protein